MRGLFARFNGGEVDTQGDAFFVTFQHSSDALACADAIQRSLRDKPICAADKDDHTVSVRIGIYRAKREVLLRGEKNYIDREINLASRIIKGGAGGQVLVSQLACTEAGNADDFQWKTWASRRLKDFDVPEDVHELLWDGNSRGEPGAQWLPDWYGGERNRYIPRADKETEILAHFATRFSDGSPVRLVTLKGFGGMGKTRLGLACALQCVGLFNGCVHFVRLEDRERSPEAVAEAIGTALELQGEQRLPANLITSLRETDALFLLDNYESVHCPNVQRFLRDLLHGTKTLRLLLTGREAVKIANLEQLVDVEGLTESEARDLFVARAQLVRPGWQPVTPEEHNALASILRDTERIPVALELVAAGMGDDTHGSIELVAQSLADTPLPALPDGYIAAEPNDRHESLSRCLDWSYNLLDPATQDGFARLGPFADTITPEAAHDAAGVPDGSKLLTRLAQASLLKRVEPRTEVRYTLLRPTRAYAHDKLTAHPAAANLRRACIAYYRNLARENGGADGHNLNNAAKRRVLDVEWRNMVGAIEDAERLQEWFAVQDIAAKIAAFFDLRGLWSESVHIGLRALAAARADKDRKNEGIALNNLGVVYRMQSRWKEAIDCYGQSLGIKRELGDQLGEGRVLNNLSVVYKDQNCWKEAITYCEQSLDICRANKDRQGEGDALNNLGVVYKNLVLYPKAIDAFEQDLTICRELADRLGEGKTLSNLGDVYCGQELWEKSINAYEQSLVIRRGTSDRVGEGRTLHNVALLYKAQGDTATALQWARQSLQVLETTQDTRSVAEMREIIAQWEQA